ncbi:uncharacterized protein METZ01_LOCUS97814 [marine metagenome]|uniref:Uncharacterized protein n=1 Tax=marine metagenome TaxID=408172 RepID=A0A381VXC7_9ZZZZ
MNDSGPICQKVNSNILFNSTNSQIRHLSLIVVMNQLKK